MKLALPEVKQIAQTAASEAVAPEVTFVTRVGDTANRKGRSSMSPKSPTLAGRGRAKSSLQWP
jgi:hypothetical protein